MKVDNSDTTGDIKESGMFLRGQRVSSVGALPKQCADEGHSNGGNAVDGRRVPTANTTSNTRQLEQAAVGCRQTISLCGGDLFFSLGRTARRVVLFRGAPSQFLQY